MQTVFRRVWLTVPCLMIPLFTSACQEAGSGDQPMRSTSMQSDPLPDPRLRGDRSLEECIVSRRSIREYAEKALSDAQISQLLWATQGVTDPAGLRAAPSAGALYPLELYVATSSGLYHYGPAGHELTQRTDRDLRPSLSAAALAQQSVAAAPAVFVITGVNERMRGKYGERTERYVHMEAGHAAQNLLLQAEALGLGGVPVGAFEDDRLARVLGLTRNESPLYLIPVGYPR